MRTIGRLIEDYIYAFGGEDLAGLIAILGIIPLVIYLVYKKGQVNDAKEICLLDRS
jgi:hypothetical protein